LIDQGGRNSVVARSGGQILQALPRRSPWRSSTFLTVRNYRSGSLLFAATLIPTWALIRGLRLLDRRYPDRTLGVTLILAGLLLLYFILRRVGALISKREWGIAPSVNLAPRLLWRFAIFDLAFGIGYGFFPYGRVGTDGPVTLLFFGNLILLIHLIPTAYGYSLRHALAGIRLLPPVLIPFDLAVFGLLLVMEAPVDFSMMVRNPTYLLPFFGRVFPGEAGVLFTWSWPFVHILLGYAVLARRKWVFYMLLAGAGMALASAGFNYYTRGFGYIRTVFVILVPLLVAYLWWRRPWFLGYPNRFIDGKEGPPPRPTVSGNAV